MKFPQKITLGKFTDEAHPQNHKFTDEVPPKNHTGKIYKAPPKITNLQMKFPQKITLGCDKSFLKKRGSVQVIPWAGENLFGSF